MAKTNGLDVRLYVEGYDLSADANSLNAVGYTNSLLDIPTLDSAAMKRLIGLADTNLTVNGWFDNAAGQIQAVFTSNSGKIPTDDQLLLIPFGSAIGSVAMGLVSKEASYDVDRPDAGGISVTSAFSANGSAAEFGKMLTAHKDTHGSAASNDSEDNSASSSSGAVAFLQVFSVASGTPTFKIEHSANDSSWSDLVSFTASPAVTAERVTVAGTVNRYLRVTSTGTFTTCVFACAIQRL